MRPVTPHSQRGSAMLAVLLMGVLFFSLATFAGSLAHSSHESSARELDNVRARLAAEEGLSMALEEVQSGIDSYGGGIGIVDQEVSGSDVVSTYSSLGGSLYQVDVTAVNRRSRAGVSAVIAITPTLAINFSPRAAITTKGSVTTTGSIVIDGRNWNESGTAVVGNGSYGISSMGSILNNGSSAVGGNGLAPTQPVPAAVKQAFATWLDGIDNDSDGSTDEEAYDGIDNDSDGDIDEDTFGYPTDPDIVLGLPTGTLKATAIAQGTYYTSETELNNAIAANGGVIPGGRIIYLDFQEWLPADLGDVYNDPPSIIVHHTTAGDAQMKNVHGMFKGLLLCDFVQHLNGDFTMLGAIMSFGNQAIGNTFGNGNAHIRLSTSVLGNLPSGGTTNSVRIISRGRTGGVT